MQFCWDILVIWKIKHKCKFILLVLNRGNNRLARNTKWNLFKFLNLEYFPETPAKKCNVYYFEHARWTPCLKILSAFIILFTYQKWSHQQRSRNLHPFNTNKDKGTTLETKQSEVGQFLGTSPSQNSLQMHLVTCHVIVKFSIDVPLFWHIWNLQSPQYHLWQKYHDWCQELFDSFLLQ